MYKCMKTAGVVTSWDGPVVTLNAQATGVAPPASRSEVMQPIGLLSKMRAYMYVYACACTRMYLRTCECEVVCVSECVSSLSV